MIHSVIYFTDVYVIGSTSSHASTTAGRPLIDLRIVGIKILYIFDASRCTRVVRIFGFFVINEPVNRLLSPSDGRLSIPIPSRSRVFKRSPAA